MSSGGPSGSMNEDDAGPAVDIESIEDAAASRTGESYWSAIIL